HFLRQLDDLHYRRQELQGRVFSASQGKARGTAITDGDFFADILEELNVAEETLHQQHEEVLATHQALLEERHRYQELFDGAPDGYLVTDTDGVILEANRAACLLLHRRRQHLVGKPLAVLVAPSEHQRFYQLQTDLEAGRDVGEQAVGFQQGDGTRLDAALTVNAIRSPWGQARGLRWLLRDSTAHTRAQQELYAARAELEKEQERTAALQQEIAVRKGVKEALVRQVEDLRHANAGLRQFINIVSHDLQQPL